MPSVITVPRHFVQVGPHRDYEKGILLSSGWILSGLGLLRVNRLLEVLDVASSRRPIPCCYK